MAAGDNKLGDRVAARFQRSAGGVKRWYEDVAERLMDDLGFDADAWEDVFEWALDEVKLGEPYASVLKKGKMWMRERSASGRSRRAAVGKYDVFSRFEEKVSAHDILALIRKHYPDVVEETFEVRGMGADKGPRSGQAWSNFFADLPDGGHVSGSVIASVEFDGHGNHRVYSYIRIDG